MRLADRGPRIWRPRWVAAVLAAVLVLGLLPAHFDIAVLARDPTPPGCQLELFADAAAATSSCPTASSTSTEELAALALLPSGFTEAVVFSGLTNPSNIEFAADGRIFVAEKSGTIKVYDNLADTTPTSFSVLPPNVHNYWDRGLLGMALDPSLTNPALPSRPWIYVLYTYDHMLGSPTAPPRWGDTCPTPPGPTTDGCVVSGRLARFTVSGTTISGPETVLIEDWCQQFPSHSQGNLAFGPDGALYVSAGDGASFNVVDYGQLGGTSGSPPPTPQNHARIRHSKAALSGVRTSGRSRRAGAGATTSTRFRRTPRSRGTAWASRPGRSSTRRAGRTGRRLRVSRATSLARSAPRTTVRSTSTERRGYVSIPDQPKLSLGNGPWSIELWARRDSTGGNYRSLIDKGSTTPGLYFDVASNRFILERSNVANIAQESGSTTDLDWHHWVVTRSANGTTTRIYKDGQDVTTIVGSQTLANTTSNLFIGAFVPSGPRFFFDGAIDEVALYNAELSSTRVETHYAAASSGGTTEPVDPRRLDPAGGPGDGQCLPGQPVRGQPGPQQAADHRLWPAEPVPIRRPTREPTSCGWATSAGRPGKRSTGSPNRRRHRRELRLAVLRGQRAASPATTRPTCRSARTLYQASGAVTAPVYTYGHSRQRGAGDGCPTGGSSTAGIAFYPRPVARSRPPTGVALFFADYTRNCIWWMAKGANGQPDPRRERCSSPGPRGRST